MRLLGRVLSSFFEAPDKMGWGGRGGVDLTHQRIIGSF